MVRIRARGGILATELARISLDHRRRGDDDPNEGQHSPRNRGRARGAHAAVGGRPGRAVGGIERRGDLVGAIATWDEESVNRVRNFTSGRAPVPTPTNYNEREVERQRRLSAKAIKELFERNHTAAMRYLRSLPAEALRRADVEKQVMGCMANHYQEHAESLRNWVAKG